VAELWALTLHDRAVRELLEPLERVEDGGNHRRGVGGGVFRDVVSDLFEV
jgi:hypothetical protein